jgi:hypothetical protein
MHEGGRDIFWEEPVMIDDFGIFSEYTEFSRPVSKYKHVDPPPREAFPKLHAPKAS